MKTCADDGVNIKKAFKIQKGDLEDIYTPERRKSLSKNLTTTEKTTRVLAFTDALSFFGNIKLTTQNYISTFSRLPYSGLFRHFVINLFTKDN